ncbi:hypothetical protein, partial [Leucobacter sp. M11]|uniref:hypothetical protein n=1 Tax=Leucobacter sp. M11 TaxID=2993565 RepID=UPI002D7F7601
GSPIDEGQTVTDQPKKPTPTPAAARPALANTGAPDTALLVLLGGVLTGLGARALLAHRSRNRRA